MTAPDAPDVAVSRAAVSLVAAIFQDCVAVVKDAQRSPDARLFALVVGRNIVQWDAGTGTVEMSSAERSLMENPLNMNM